MPSDQNPTKNQDSTENSIPPSPQEPTANILIDTTGSESVTTPSEPLESSTTTDTPSLANNDNQGIISENNPIIPTESEKPLENQAPISEPNQIKPELEKIPENPLNIITEPNTPVSTSQTPTAQIPVNEPLAPESAAVPDSSEAKPEIKPEPVSETKPESKPTPEVIPIVAIIPKSKSLARELLIKARNMIQFRKRKKLDKIMTLFSKQTKITNDEVEKFLHISDATTGRYLAILVKEGKIKRNGKTGKSVFYSKI